MEKNPPPSIPIGILIADAVEAAKLNDRAKAIHLLNEADREAYKRNLTSREKNIQLINLIKDKYNLHEKLEFLTEADKNNGRVGDGVVEPLPGISIVNCARNRTENLLLAIPTWLALNDVREVIIVDWTSDYPVKESLKENGITDPRVKIVRVQGEPRWILSYAFNLGFRLARHEYILKVDADITIKTDFVSKNPLIPGTFVAGDWQKAEKGQEHINGFFYLRSKDLLKIKGFNEYITTYGWDDDDIYSRLITSGLQRVCVDTKSIYHIPHDDASRLDGLSKNNANSWSQLNGDTLFKIRANRFLTINLPYWNADRFFAPFKIINSEDNSVDVQRVIVDMPHIVSASMRRDAEIYSAFELMSWRLGPSVYAVDRQHFERLFESKKLEEISKFDLDVIMDETCNEIKYKRYSIYLEFNLALLPKSFDNLCIFIDKLKSLDYFNLFISHYGLGAAEFAELCGPRAIRLNRWVRSEGLVNIDPSNLVNLVVLSTQGSGCLLQITDDFLLQLYSKFIDLKQFEFTLPSKDKLYIDTQHGLGNRLRALGSAAAIARATNRELIVVWVPDFHCECEITDLFDVDFTIINSYEKIPSELKKINYMENEGGSNKGELIDLKPGEDVLVRSAFVLNHPASNWDTENAIFRTLPLNEVVNALVSSIKLAKATTAVHVRMEAGFGLDNNKYDSQENWSKESHEQIHFWRDKSHYSKFMKRIDALLEENPAEKFYLATDLAENYSVFKKVYGDKLIFLKRETYDRSKAQIQFALADVILLSKCQRFLGSTWSSFSEIAMRYSTSFRKIEMSGKDF